MFRRNVKWALALSTALLVAGTVAASAQPIPLNYNFNGMIHADEWSGGWPGDPGVADVPNGFRSLSDRALRVDGQSGAIDAQPLVGATGLTYTVVPTGHVVDIVMLGNRNLVDNGNWAFDAAPDGDNVGIQPTWLPNPDLTGPQTTTISPAIALAADFQIGVLYNITNGGGAFQIVLGFTDNPSITVDVTGPDWFGGQNDWYASNSIPSPVWPYGGIASLSRLGQYSSVYWVDNPAPTVSTLNVAEVVLTVAQMYIDGLGDLTGKHLSSITFRNPSNANSFGIYAVSVGGGAAPGNDECENATLVSEGIFQGTSGGATGYIYSSCGFWDDYNDVWYLYQATRTGTARASLCGSGFDTTLSLFDACDGTELACNDDYCDLQSQLDFDVVAGMTYLLRIAGNGGAAGSFTLTITNPADILYGPVVNPANGHTYYLLNPYTWTEAEARAIELGGHLVTLNDGDEQNWVLQNVVRVGGMARTSWIGFTDQAEEGNWKWINNQHAFFTNWNGGEPNNAGGTEHYCEMQDGGGWNDVNNDAMYHYGVVEIPTPPANDECAAALALTEGQFYGDSDGATGTSTSSCGVGDTRDVWFDYVASRTGATRISLCCDLSDHLFDTTIAVYSACGGAELACNNDFCGQISQVDFNVVAGTHYRVRVAGNAGATGGFRMTITNPPGIVCGPVVNPANGSQYYLITKDSWSGAEARAVAMGGHLATINDAAENTWVRDNVLACVYGDVRWAWIGLYETAPNSNIWVWSSGQIAGYRNWSGGEPNLLDTELYAQMVTDGTWNNLPDEGHWWLGGEYALVEIDAAGACCFTDETCAVLLPAQCAAQGGLFLGGGTDCTPNPCVAGACCMLDGTCSLMTPAECVAANGTFDGAPSCDPNPCAQPGVCCLDDVCQMSPTLGPAWCITQGGLYQGDNTTCETNPCPQDECADAGYVLSNTPIYGRNHFATGTDISSCAGGGDGDWNDVWYKWRAPCDGSATFGLCQGNWFDSSIAVYASCGGAELACDDDGCGWGGGPSVVTINVTNGASYYIRIAGWSGSTGEFQLEVTHTPCAGACCVDGVCIILPQAECVAGGGTYKGDGVSCDPNPCSCVGDLNCDGQVSFADINPFVLYLSNYSVWTTTYAGCNPENGDINGDAAYPSFGDINAFVTLLSTNPLPIICP